jgi:hypothetical protein
MEKDVKIIGITGQRGKLRPRKKWSRKASKMPPFTNVHGLQLGSKLKHIHVSRCIVEEDA